jgi:uncharacterized protein YciI
MGHVTTDAGLSLDRKLFAVIRTRGDAWQPLVPLELQQGWNAHASFMDGLHDEGFLVLVGPLEGTPDFLLIVRARDRNQIEERFAADPWSRTDLLRITRISPWTIRLGSIP